MGNEPRRVLHALANSRPDFNGYAIRSHEILRAQCAAGIEAIAVTSPYYPEREAMIEDQIIDGVEYIRCRHPVHDQPRSMTENWLAKSARRKLSKPKSVTKSSGIERVIRGGFSIAVKPIRLLERWLEERILLRKLRNQLVQVGKERGSEVIHAHTPYRVGAAAAAAAKRLDIPFIYEVRGLWEETAITNGRWRREGPFHRRFRRLETKTMLRADGLLCISEQLKKDVITRGVNPDVVTMVPNGADPNIRKSPPAMRDEDELELKETRRKVNPDGEAFVVGYIGSIQVLEGIDTLVEAMSLLRLHRDDARLLIVSGHSNRDWLKQLLRTHEIEDITTIAGPVPWEHVPRYHALTDVFVIPRPDERVCRMVTPLKPFEAMILGSAVVVSDLPALREIIRDGETGLIVPPQDPDSLAAALARLADDPEERGRLGQAASDWVEEKRTWRDVVNLTTPVYDRLCRNGVGRTSDN